MATEKTFDKADLLRFYHEDGSEAMVGKFAVIHPPTPQQLAFDQDATKGETTRYPVIAETVGLYCERYGFSVVMQSVVFPDGGNQYLPKLIPLRVLAGEHRTIIRYGGSVAQLVRWATELADEWRDEVTGAMPVFAIDQTRRIGDEATERMQAEVDKLTDVYRVDAGEQPDAKAVADEIHANLEAEIAKMEAEDAASVDDHAPDDPDHTPTGESIDDVLSQHDGDEGEATA